MKKYILLIMSKAKLKTKPNRLSVSKYLNDIKDEDKRSDCRQICKIMELETNSKPKMWGDKIVGFGEKKLIYPSGRQVDWFMMGLSPRKNNISIYLTCNLDQLKDDLKKLGKFKRGSGCLYIKTLKDIEIKVLKNMIKKSKKLIL